MSGARLQQATTAMYLVGQGRLREPRLIEVQHLRIFRFLGLLSDMEGRRFGFIDEFVDLNFPRAQSWEELPALCELMAGITDGRYDTVLVDFFDETYSLNAFSPRMLEQPGVEVLNAYTHGAELEERRIRELCEVDHRVDVPEATEEEVVAFFPALAAGIVQEIVEGGSATYHKMPDSVYELMDRVSRLRAENVYAGGHLPRYTHARSHYWSQLAREAAKAHAKGTAEEMGAIGHDPNAGEAEIN